MRAFKPFSIDMTSWQTAQRYGALTVYTGNGRWERLNKTEVDLTTVEIPKGIVRAAEICGLSLADLRTSDRWYTKKKFGGFRNSISAMLNAYSWVQYCREYDERFGTRIFLAGVGFNAGIDKALYYWINRFSETRREDILDDEDRT